MIGWYMRVSIAILSIAAFTASAVSAATTATVSLVDPGRSWRDGDVVALRGEGFAPNDVIDYVLLTKMDGPNGLAEDRFIVAPNFSLVVDRAGVLTGTVKLSMLDALDTEAMLLPVARGSSVRSTERFPVTGGSARAAKPAFNTEISFTFDDAGGLDATKAELSEQLNLTGTYSGAGDLDRVGVREYSSIDATSGAVRTTSNLSTANVTWVQGGAIGGYLTNVSSWHASTVTMRVLLSDVADGSGDLGENLYGDGILKASTNYMTKYDASPPAITSAWATGLTTIVVNFSKSVTVPALLADARDNFTIAGTAGSSAISGIAELGSSGTASITLTLASSLADRGATPSVQFATGTNEYEDGSGNDCGSYGPTSALDKMAPAAITFNNPTDAATLIGTSASFALQATIGSGTDNSLDAMIFDGWDGSTWTQIGSTITSPSPATLAEVTWDLSNAANRYKQIRVRAFDNASGSTADVINGGDNVTTTTLGATSGADDLTTAFRMQITATGSAVAASNGGDAGRSVAVTFRTENRYGVEAAANGGNITWSLSSNSTGTPKFWSDDPASALITTMDAGATGNTSKTVYYTDTKAGSPTLTVSKSSPPAPFTAGNATHTGGATITAGSATQTIVVLPGQTYVPGVTTLAAAVTGSASNRTAGAVIGTPYVVVRAVDDFFNTNTSNSDAISLTCTDANWANATPPTNFSAGVAEFQGVTLKTANLGASEGGTSTTFTAGTFSGTNNTSSTFVVDPGTASKLVAILPNESFAPGTASGKSGSAATQTAGSPFSVVVRVTDANSNRITGDTRTVTIDGSTASTQSYGSAAALVSGEKTFAVTERQATTGHWFRATASGVTNGQTNDVPMQTSTATKLLAIMPGVSHAPGTASGKSGTPAAQTANANLDPGSTVDSIRVYTTDDYWNRVPVGSATDVTFSTTDGSATITNVNGGSPGHITIGATATFGGMSNTQFIFRTPGTQTVTVTDAAAGLDSYTSGNVTVNSGAASKILVKLPGQGFTSGVGITGAATNRDVGVGFTVTLYIVDANNNVVSETSTRTIDFSTTAGVSPAPTSTSPTVNTGAGAVTFSSGTPANNQSVDFAAGVSTSTITIALYKAELDRTITAADDGGSPLTGTASSLVDVNVGALSTFVVSLTATAERNVAFTGTNTVTASDAYSNTITTFDASGTNVTMAVDGEADVVRIAARPDGILDLAGDFTSGVANLTSLGIKYIGAQTGALNFKATAGAVVSAFESVTITVTGPTVATPSPADNTQIATSSPSQSLSATFTETNAGGSYTLHWSYGNNFDGSSPAGSSSKAASTGGGSISASLTSELSSFTGYDYLHWWFEGTDGAGNALTGSPTTGSRARIILDPTVTFAGSQIAGNLTVEPTPHLYVNATGEMTGMSVTVTRLQFTKSGTATHEDINELRLYRDTNTDNAIDGGDVLLQTISVTDNSTLNSPNFNSFSQTQTVSGTGSIRLLLAVVVAPTATASNTLSYQIGNGTAVTLGGGVADVGGSFPLPSATDVTLPVKLTTFAGEARASGITLTWVTASEQSNAGFVISRATGESGPYLPVSNLIPGGGTTATTNEYRWTDVAVTAGSTYWYRIESRDYDGTVHPNDMMVRVTAAVPLSWALRPVAPNPFNPSTVISWEAPESGDAVVAIYDVTGRRVRTLLAGPMAAGVHRATWDGTDENGAAVASGIYLIRYVAAGGTIARTTRAVLAK